MSQTIIIPPFLRSDTKGFNFLAELLCLQPQNEGEQMLIDFSFCRMFDGNLAAVLGAILDSLTGLGFEIRLTRPVEKGVRRILGRNHFLQAWLIESSVEEKENFIEYKRFRSNGPSDEFKAYVDTGLIHKQKFPAHTEGVASKIVENICEMFANAITHGHSNYVYSCGEYKREAQILEMTIVDCGISIPENVNTFLKSKGKDTLSPCDAIKWAFVKGHTTKDHPGGLGLTMLREFIELNKGSIQMVSDCGFVEYSGDKVEAILLPTPFHGTVVNMKFNFNDQMKYYLTTEVDNLDINDLL